MELVENSESGLGEFKTSALAAKAGNAQASTEKMPRMNLAENCIKFLLRQQIRTSI